MCSCSPELNANVPPSWQSDPRGIRELLGGVLQAPSGVVTGSVCSEVDPVQDPVPDFAIYVFFQKELKLYEIALAKDKALILLFVN